MGVSASSTMIDYLPDCSCVRGGICPIHGPLERGRVQRRALHAVKRGKIMREDHQKWLAKYGRKPKQPFGQTRKTKRFAQ